MRKRRTWMTWRRRACDSITFTLRKIFARLEGSPFSPDARRSASALSSLGAMRPEEITLAKALTAAGYRTGHFGKWHLGERSTSPVRMGFDTAIWHVANFEAGGRLQIGDGRRSVRLDDGDTSLAVVRLALTFIREQATQRAAISSFRSASVRRTGRTIRPRNSRRFMLAFPKRFRTFSESCPVSMRRLASCAPSYVRSASPTTR